MLDGAKNIKDTTLPIKDTSFSLSYNKTNKLITALYMVTDIIPTEEPVRHTLRTLGVELISDIHVIKVSMKADVLNSSLSKTISIISLIDLCSSLGIISDMNAGILKREFIELRDSLAGAQVKFSGTKDRITLSTFLLEEDEDYLKNLKDTEYHSIGHKKPTRIGVQSGGSLMKVLSDRVSNIQKDNLHSKNKESQEMLKKERRFEIVRIIKDKSKLPNYNGLTISDIRTMSDSEALRSCSEKTLQRELVSMVSDSVLYKTGSKRWSRYFLKAHI